MNTDQKYAGKGDYATSTQQNGSTLEQTAKLPDNRQAIYDAQSELLKLVDDFVNEGYASGPVEVINRMLYHWLTTSAVELHKSVNKNHLESALSLVNFLTALFEHQVQLDRCQEKEVSNGI